MEAKAILRFARITPRKARRVVDLIRGKRASEAMVSLKFMPYRGAKLVEKVL
jgi:large subunit ribosomal protein L22